jgi:hypothetical protein
LTLPTSFQTGDGRTIPFTLSWIKNELYDPRIDDARNAYVWHIEYPNPDDRAYLCLMYTNPPDMDGLNNLTVALRDALFTDATSSDYLSLPVRPIPYANVYDAQADAVQKVTEGGIAASCRWGGQFELGTKLALDFGEGSDSTYRAQPVGRISRRRNPPPLFDERRVTLR